MCKGWFLEGGEVGAAPCMSLIMSAALEVAMAMSYLHANDLIHGNLRGGETGLHLSPLQETLMLKGRQRFQGDCHCSKLFCCVPSF